ncbi:AraC family ligand binding domain-containing protein [Ruminococcus champanellensis]|uniref:AraC family ligand binding domain-containing protein n=1 Tax=Ruminococcus champanellensis TaxID=1161942 RepID=UPI0026DAFA3D|nr:AraC family ligand binding domain-containing protein [Ruminococcus champanellensis]
MFQVTQSQPRMLGCKAPEPLPFSVCGQLISPSGFLHHRRCFAETVLILVTKGTLYLNANGSPFALTAGTYILLPAGEEHFGFRSSEGSLSYLWAHFRTKQGFEPVHADDAKGYSYLLPETAFASPSGRTAQLFHQLIDLSLDDQLYTHSMSD